MTTDMKQSNYEACLAACETIAAKVDASDDVWINGTGASVSVGIGPRAAAELVALLHG